MAADKFKPFLDKPLEKINFNKIKSPALSIDNNILIELKSLIQSENFDLAVTKCSNLLEKYSDSLVIWDVMAFSNQKLGNFDQAIKCYKKVLSIDSSSITSYYNLGIIYYELGHLKQSNTLFLECKKIDNDFKEIHLPHAKVLFKLQKFDQAKESCAKSISLSGLNSEKANLMACILTDLMELDEAEKFFEICLEQKELNYKHLNNYATFLKVINNINKSIDLYLKVLELNKDYSLAFRHLSEIAPERVPDEILTRMEDNLSNEKISKELKAHIGFGLWEIYSYKKSSKAFQYLKKGNNLYREIVAKSFSVSPDNIISNNKKEAKNYIDDQEKFEKIFDSQLIIKEQKAKEVTPIFVVGLPRSGTTLVEQILSSHPDIDGAGELRYINDIYQIITSSEDWENENFSLENLLNLKKEYLDNIKKYSTQSTKSIVDKMPANFFLLGLIKKIFPNSKIINIERNPIDNCFSIYTKIFSSGHTYAYDLEDIGNYYLIYKKTMGYWYNILNKDIYELKYEDLISNLREETKKLLHFCNYDFHEDCVKFYQNKRPVLTASNIQVRKKIYNTSVGKWKKYEDELIPLINILRG